MSGSTHCKPEASHRGTRLDLGPVCWGGGCKGPRGGRGQEPQLQLSRSRAPTALEQRQGREPTAAEDQNPSTLTLSNELPLELRSAEPGAS